MPKDAATRFLHANCSWLLNQSAACIELHKPHLQCGPRRRRRRRSAPPPQLAHVLPLRGTASSASYQPLRAPREKGKKAAAS